MSIPIANPVISEAAKDAVCDVLDSGMIADGEVVREFEAEFADYVDVDHAIATSSGTTALHAMLEAAGIGPGDVVLTTPFSFIASANAVRHAGAEVTFAEIRPDTYNLNSQAVRAVLDERPDISALMPVHLYGLPAAMKEYRAIAKEYNLLLFEDAAQAHGATVHGESVGSIGDAGAFSFYPTKNMTTGEGGMITTDDDDIAENARKLVNHGRSGTYEHEMVGYNYRMTNIQAAIGRDQLSRLPSWIETRRTNAGHLTDELNDVSDLVTPSVPVGREHAFHQYTVRTRNRERLRDRLSAADIGASVYYPTPITQQPPYEDAGSFPVAARLSETVVSLPVHPQIDAEDIDRIVDVIIEAEVAA